jgi:hypothetical protein
VSLLFYPLIAPHAVSAAVFCDINVLMQSGMGWRHLCAQLQYSHNQR